MLILPKLAAMSDGQIWMVEDFVWCGGSVVYTGVTGMLDEWSEARSCFPLDELFGICRRDVATPLCEQRRACESWEQLLPAHLLVHPGAGPPDPALVCGCGHPALWRGVLRGRLRPA